jgi:methylthioribulose-1-phosphate dehydratase
MKEKLQELLDCGQQFYDRRWMWGTSGNLSVRLKEKPLEIAITPSGLNKGHLSTEDLVILKDGEPPKKHPKNHITSSETIIHQEIYRALPGCGAVFHVHPIYATLMSQQLGDPKKPTRFLVEWFEMMKGVGVGEEETAEVMVLPNWQDVSLIARDARAYIESKTGKILPAVLIYNHGLTAWGHTPEAARNHLEIMEYVCQYLYLRKLGK